MQQTTVQYRSYTDFSSPLVISRPPLDGFKRFRVKVMIQPIEDDDDEFERLPREEVMAEMDGNKGLFDRLAKRFPYHA